MKFDINKPYRQRCGLEAKVTVTDLTGDYPLGGWCIGNNGVKMPMTWTREGDVSERLCSFINNCADLVNISEVLDINGKPVPQEVLDKDLPEGVSHDDVEYIIDYKPQTADVRTWVSNEGFSGWQSFHDKGKDSIFHWEYAMRFKKRKDGTPTSIDPLPEVLDINGKPVPQEVLDIDMPEGISRDDIEYFIRTESHHHYNVPSETWATDHPPSGWVAQIPEGETSASWSYSMRLKHRKDGTPTSINPLPEIEGYKVEYKGLRWKNNGEPCEFILWSNIHLEWRREERIPDGWKGTHYALLTPISKPYTIDTFPVWAVRIRRKGNTDFKPAGSGFFKGIVFGGTIITWEELMSDYEIAGPEHDWQPAHEGGNANG